MSDIEAKLVVAHAVLKAIVGIKIIYEERYQKEQDENYLHILDMLDEFNPHIKDAIKNYLLNEFFIENGDEK